MRASGDRLVASSDDVRAPDRVRASDGVRASDAERDEAIHELRERFAEGLLSHDTFLYRMDVALQAKDRADLSSLFADLREPDRPEPRPREPDPPESGRPGSDRPASGRRPGVGRLIRARLAQARRAAAIALGGSSLPSAPARPPQLCLPPQTSSTFTIGREVACDFTLADLSVSRWHARLHREEDRWLLCDLGSTNGTRLNGWRVTTEVPVQAGDRVTFGSITFVVIDHPTGTE
jgi:FHA domain/Domain of unknown function (DUF1707)